MEDVLCMLRVNTADSDVLWNAGQMADSGENLGIYTGQGRSGWPARLADGHSSSPSSPRHVCTNASRVFRRHWPRKRWKNFPKQVARRSPQDLFGRRCSSKQGRTLLLTSDRQSAPRGMGTVSQENHISVYKQARVQRPKPGWFRGPITWLGLQFDFSLCRLASEDQFSQKPRHWLS